VELWLWLPRVLRAMQWLPEAQSARFRWVLLLKQVTLTLRSLASRAWFHKGFMLQLVRPLFSMRWRMAAATAIGVTSGVFCWFLMVHFHQDAADLRWALRLASRFLAHQELYDTPLQQYPFVTALFAFPFLWLKPEVAAGIFWGVSSFLLALGLTRDGYRKLLIFLAYPYWAGILTVQWSPLIAASAFFPLLLPVTMAKPQVGLPVFLTRFSVRGTVACVVVGIVSLALLPSWPMQWLRHGAPNYPHFFPLLVLPGPLLLLALLRYRDRDALLLFISAALPQRWFFDSFILWLIPQSRREIVWTVFFSWGAGIWRWYYFPHSFTEVGRWTVVFFYLPMLAVVLLRKAGSGALQKTDLPASTSANTSTGIANVV